VVTSTQGADTGIAITVRNRGVAAAGAFTVAVYSGATITDTNPILFTTAVGALAIGGETTVNGVIAGRPANLYAVADPERLVAEMDEANILIGNQLSAFMLGAGSASPQAPVRSWW